VAHSNPVADRYRIEFEGSTASLAHGTLNNPRYLVQMNMPGHYITVAVGNTDKWFVNIGVTKTAGVKQTPVRCPLKAFLYRVASHVCPFSKRVRKVNLEAQKADFNN
jgi:hypothetical protein